jgi:asparagine synthase (glutamine-hydrolysing)
VEKRVKDKDHVGIIFSGGIDSLLIAYEVQKLNIPFTCYTAGREGGSDIEWARRLALEFDFPLKAKILSTDEIKELIPQLIIDIEDSSLNQIEVSVPIYVSVRMAQEAGERVILTGQGADELFGGYPWYARIVDQEGYDSFVDHSWQDTFFLYKECLEREDKISMAHSIELRVPFLDPEVIKTAFDISPELKLKKGNDLMGKQIHRKYCISRGIPQQIAFRK